MVAMPDNPYKAHQARITRPATDFPEADFAKVTDKDSGS